MGIFSKLKNPKRLLTGPPVTAPQLSIDFNKFDKLTGALEKVATNEITNNRKSAQTVLDRLELQRDESTARARAVGQGQLQDTVSALALQGGVSSGARERAAEGANRAISEQQQGVATEVLDQQTGVAAQDFAAQESNKFESQKLIPQFELSRIGIKTKADAGNLQAKNIADTQNRLAKRKFTTSVLTAGGLFG